MSQTWSDLAFAATRRTLRAHLAQRGAEGQWDFAHAQLRQAVLRRNLAGPDAARGIHCRLGEYLEALLPKICSTRARRWCTGLGRTSGGVLRATMARSSWMMRRLVRPKPSQRRFLPVRQLTPIRGSHGQCRAACCVSEIGTTYLGHLCSRFSFDLHNALVSEGTLTMRGRLLEVARAVLEDLATDDPHNPAWQRGLSIIHIKFGNVRRMQGDLAEALEASQAGLTITERLADKDPRKCAWQRDISVCHDNIGVIYMTQGNPLRRWKHSRPFSSSPGTSPPRTLTTPPGSVTFRLVTGGSAMFRRRKGISSGRWRPTRPPSQLGGVSPQRSLTTQPGSATSRSFTIGSATYAGRKVTCAERWRLTMLPSQLLSALRRQTPPAPLGSATFPLAPMRSALCAWRKATSQGR